MAQKKKKKMALYEVFSKGLGNSSGKRKIETFHLPQSPSAGGPAGGFGRPISKNAVTKPRMFQINCGRVEISMPTQLAVAILLFAAVLFLTAYRLGQWQGLSENAAVVSEPAGDENVSQPDKIEKTVESAVETSRKTDIMSSSAQLASGSNWIVLATHKNREQLIPVQAFFSGYGIETQIRQKGQMFFLHTKQTYDNPQRQGTDGWRMKEKIIKIGDSYEPPAGYGNFDFKTVYGMKSFE